MPVLMLEKFGMTEFEGAINAQMPVLVGRGLVPATFADVMRLRNEVLQPCHSDDVRRAVWLNYVDTGTSHVRHADGSLVIAERPDYLLSLTPATILKDGVVQLTDEQYSALRGARLAAGQVEKHSGKLHSTVSEVLENLIWRALAGNDGKLLDEYARNTFDLASKWFDAEGNLIIMVMNAHVTPLPAKGAGGRLWSVYGLGDLIGGSRADSFCHLGGSNGRLVGVVPEAQRAVLYQPTIYGTRG